MNKPEDYAKQMTMNNGQLTIGKEKKEPDNCQLSTVHSQLEKPRFSFANLLTRFFGEAPESDKGAALEW